MIKVLVGAMAVQSLLLMGMTLYLAHDLASPIHHSLQPSSPSHTRSPSPTPSSAHPPSPCPDALPSTGEVEELQEQNLRLASALKRMTMAIQGREVEAYKARYPEEANAIFPPTATLAEESEIQMGGGWRGKAGVGVGGRDVVVVSYNVWNTNPPWGERKKRIGRWLEEVGGDIIALQELRRHPDGLHQMEEMEEVLGKEYSGVYAHMRGKEGEGGDEEGIALFTRFPVLHSQVISLLPLSGVAKDQRVLLHVVVEVGSGVEVDVFTSHWPVYDYEQCHTALQIRNVTERVRAEHPERAQILLGDLNVYFDFEYPIRLLTHPFSRLTHGNTSPCAPVQSAFPHLGSPPGAPWIDAFDASHPILIPTAPPSRAPSSGESGQALPERWWGAPMPPLGLTFPTFTDTRIQDGSRPDRILFRPPLRQDDQRQDDQRQDQWVKGCFVFGREPFFPAEGSPKQQARVMFPSDHLGVAAVVVINP